MRRMVLRETGPVETERLGEEEGPPPEPQPGQIVLRVLACAVCHTDLHLAEGEVEAPLPRVLGHQVIGLVEALGSDVTSVTSVTSGQRVGVGWLASTCGSCRFCRSDRENLCLQAKFTGRDVDGGYAEFMVADPRFVHPVPEGLPTEEAAPLLCAGIIGYRALKLSGLLPGQRLGLYGFGASAHLVLQVARAWDCETYVFTRSEAHRRLALDLGARWAGGAEGDPGVALDAAVSFAPAGWIVPAVLARLDRGATLAVNAIHASDIPSFPYGLLYWERTVRSVANFTQEDAREFLALAAREGVRARVERFALEQANEALIRLKRGEIEGAAVLVP